MSSPSSASTLSSILATGNPLRAGMRNARNVDPCIMVIFGATGDLTHRKLLPALYNLALEQPLPPQFTVVGVARRPFTHEQFRQQALDSINQFSRRRPVNPAVWETFSKGLFYHQSQFDDPEGFRSLSDLVRQLDQERGTGGRYIFYLATPPSFYGGIGDLLRQADLARRDYASPLPWPRIIIEKPFGHDLPSALALNDK
ncbi:MAG TPA: glucose-6-phosphate dehydrogenase, partial [Ktedonobacterales bacterium]|nr:glucose-6-phosphate dehydrogenase [Ktedonobacterales bacterium]